MTIDACRRVRKAHLHSLHLGFFEANGQGDRPAMEANRSHAHQVHLTFKIRSTLRRIAGRLCDAS